MLNRYLDYKYKDPFSFVRWSWKQLFFIKWCYHREIIEIIPKHVNCRCSIVSPDAVDAYMYARLIET